MVIYSFLLGNKKKNANLNLAKRSFMIYTRYFSLTTKRRGLSFLDASDIDRWLNIVFHEGKLEALYQMREAGKSCEDLEIKLEQLNVELLTLTEGLRPEQLMLLMLTGQKVK